MSIIFDKNSLHCPAPQSASSLMNQMEAYPHEIAFIGEDQIARSIGANDWVTGCGHDCCTCDSECK